MMRHRHTGFTLIELVMIIVVLAICLTGLIAAFGVVGGSGNATAGIDVGAQVASQCAEHVLGQRQRNVAVGFANYAGGACGGLGFGGFTVSDTVSALTGGICPAGASCKSVTITASSAAASTTLNLLLVDY